MSPLGYFILKYIKPSNNRSELLQGISSDDLVKTLNLFLSSGSSGMESCWTTVGKEG